MARRVRLAIATGVIIVVAATLVVMSQRAPRVAYSNTTVERSGAAVLVAPGAQRCQLGEILPEGTGAARIFVGTSGRVGGPLELVVRRPGPTGRPIVLTRGTLAAPVREGSYDVRLRPVVRRDVSDGAICLINRGRIALSLAGNRTPAVGGANPAAVRLDDNARVDYLLEGRRSWWSVAGRVANRFGLTKTTFFGTWTFWAVFAVFVSMAGAVIVLLSRVLGRDS